MKISNKTAWNDLVYNLLYPAILGSMLYDLFSPSVLEKWRFMSKILIALLYTVDYLHLYNDLNILPRLRSKTFSIALDGIIALTFRAIFSLIILQKLWVPSLLLFLIFFEFLVYNHRQKRPTTFLFPPVVFLLANFIFSFALSRYSSIWLFFMLLAIFLYYSVYVFNLWQRYSFTK